MESSLYLEEFHESHIMSYDVMEGKIRETVQKKKQLASPHRSQQTRDGGSDAWDILRENFDLFLMYQIQASVDSRPGPFRREDGPPTLTDNDTDDLVYWPMTPILSQNF